MTGVFGSLDGGRKYNQGLKTRPRPAFLEIGDAGHKEDQSPGAGTAAGQVLRIMGKDAWALKPFFPFANRTFSYLRTSFGTE